MKVGIVITTHCSNHIRPYGNDFADILLKSIEECIKFNYVIYLIDNESQHTLDYKKYKNIKYFKINDQSIEGLTGAWNLGIDEAYKDECSLILNLNDDLIMHESINNMIEYISKDPESLKTIYGCMTNDAIINIQMSSGPEKSNSTYVMPSLNAFLFCFTKEHYEKYKFSENKYFNINNKYNEGDGKWGGQEGYFKENYENNKTICKILKFVWVKHNKKRSWKIAKNYYNKK